MPSPPAPSDAPSDLSWTDAGAPRSDRFSDVYFSVDDGLAESRAVFLTGCGLPDAWAGRSSFTVAELGFGTGLNIVALIDLWRRSGPPDGCLRVFSVEAYPLTRDEAKRALATWPELAEVSAALLASWPARTPGFHRVDLPQFRVTIDLAVGDAAWALDQWSGPADAWFLDGFSPALNPGMWSDAVLDAVAAKSAPGARLASFTVAGGVRRGLTERGFTVEKRPGHGRKRERLEACRSGHARIDPTPRSAVVIGAGIAGAAACRALVAFGMVVTVIEADRPGVGASGFPAALVTPRLDAGDPAIAALHAQALARANQLYGQIPGSVIATDVLQLEQAPRDARRFTTITAQDIWPAGDMATVSADDASRVLGETVGAGLAMAGALTVRPDRILEAWLSGVEMLTGAVTALKPSLTGWAIMGVEGRVLAEADAVVIAAGWGTATLAPDLGLAPVRGQADWIDGISSPAVAWGGYVAPTADGVLFGATHDRGVTTTEPSDEDSRRNLETLAARLPGLAEKIAAAGPTSRRAAIRATTRDRLPVCGPAPGPPGVFLLTGLGSRGFCLAPLLGEHLAALILGAPSPLPHDLAAKVSTERFIVNATAIAQPAGELHG